MQIFNPHEAEYQELLRQYDKDPTPENKVRLEKAKEESDRYVRESLAKATIRGGER